MLMNFRALLTVQSMDEIVLYNLNLTQLLSCVDNAALRLWQISYRLYEIRFEKDKVTKSITVLRPLKYVDIGLHGHVTFISHPAKCDIIS